MAHPQRHRSIPRIAIAICALTQAGAQAATFFDQSEAFSLSDQQLAQLEVQGYTSNSNAKIGDKNRPYVQIDDMLFPVTDTRSAFSGTRWTDGIVYYVFDASVNPENQQHFRDAAALWSDVARLEFIEGEGNGNYIYVMDALVNNSFVGMIGGAQTLNMYNWNVPIIIAHEIGHALGLSHEQSRSDRDNYVIILFENIEPGQEHNFALDKTENYGEYDFESIMHYGKDAFSVNGGNTIEPLPEYAEYLDVMGQRSQLSELDIAGMAARYGIPFGLYYRTNHVDDATATGNADGEVNPGETINLTVTIANTTGVTNNNVTVTLSTDDPFVTLTQDSQTIAVLKPLNAVVTPAFEFTVATNYPSGEPIYFDVVFTSDEDAGNDSFEVPVTGVFSGAIERVVNGDYARFFSPEEGITNAAGWELTGDFFAEDLPEGSRSEPGHAYLGEPEVYNLMGECSQLITLPSDRTRVILSYWYNIESTEIGGRPYDYFTVRVAPEPVEDPMEVLPDPVSHTFSNLDEMDGYARDTLDLSAFAGRRVFLSFSAITDVSRATIFQVDDVSILAYTGGMLDYVDHEVHDGIGGGTGNGDGNVDPGETIELALILTNSSTNVATGIQGTLTSTSDYVSITDSNVTFADIPGESTATNSSTFGFDVDESAAGQVLDFTLRVETDLGLALVHDFSIVVPGTSALSYAGSMVKDGVGGGAGNGDGILHPGEDIDLDVKLLNAGPDQAVAVAGILSCTNEYVTIQDDTVDWGNIPAKTTQWGSDFDFRIDWKAPLDTKLLFTLALSSAEGGSWTNTFTLTVGGEPAPPNVAGFERTGQTWRLEWAADTGTVCRVYSTTDLTEPTVWNLESVITGTGDQTSFEADFTDELKFFRIECDE